MATTTRRKKRVKPAESVDKIIEKPIDKVSKVSKKKSSKKSSPITHLEIEDLRQIENLSKDVVIAKAYMSNEEQYLRNMNLELQLLSIKIEKQRDVVQQKSNFFEQKKAKYAEYKKNINPKYGLEPDVNLGYNPETGEIIR